MRERAEDAWLQCAGVVLAALLCAAPLCAQTQAVAPIAIVPLDNKNPESAATVTGSLVVTQDKAVIAASGSVTAGKRTVEVTLPQRGVLRVCASTTVKLAADASAPKLDKPGLMMAIERGAVEASFAAGSTADVLLTPDFRILISGPGSVELKVRLGQGGDTCVDNAGSNAPYVLVTSVFDGGNYRVQAGQRVMFQHGSLQQVVDNEKEPCGCPPAPAESKGNEFPMAQSAGLEPLPAPKPAEPGTESGPVTAPLVYKSEGPQPAVQVAAAGQGAAAVEKKPAEKKPGLFSRVGRFFRHLFGGE
jgi:hypothetical protein